MKIDELREHGIALFIIAGLCCFAYFVLGSGGNTQPSRPSPPSQPPAQQESGSVEKFKAWCLSNTAVTDIHVEGPSMFVSLSPEKYTTKENVSAIAGDLARAYVLQTGISYANCRIYLGSEVYASGDFRK